MRHDARLTDALAGALACLRRRPLLTSLGFLPYALAFLALAAGAAQLVGVCDVSRPGALRVALVLGLHQLVLLAAVALRAGWLARALRLSAATALPRAA